MQRGCVNNFPISANIARERSAWSAIDSNSDGALRLWRPTDFGSVSANAAESAVAAEQPIAATRKNERTDIVLTSNLKGKHEAQQLFHSAEAEVLFYFPI